MAMGKKMLFVYNPFAGKELIKNKLSDIIQKFNGDGYEVTVYATQGPKFATNIIAEMGEQYDMVVCSGGDGTLNEAVTGLMMLENRPVCGYIPAGTVNDFASSLRIPKNMLNAADVILNGQEFACDIGSFNETNFNYIAGFGAFTEVAYETSQAVKNVLGRMAYLLDGVKRLPSIKSYHMTINHDGKEYSDEFLFGMVSNSQSVGGFKLMSGRRKVKMDDGLFESAFIKMPKNPLELERTLNAVLAREIDERYIYAFRGSDIKITSEEEVQWTLDGESGGFQKDIHIQNNKQAIRIMRPAPRK